MNRTHIIIAGLILLEILLLFLGCQGDGSDPSTPVPHPGVQETLIDDVVTGQTDTSEAGNGPALWGYYQITYDSSRREITAIPLRGVEFSWNVVSFLQPPKTPIHNLGINILDDSEFLSTGRIDVRVILHHPFPGQPYYTGFDVCGIFMTEGSLASPYDTDLTYANDAVDPTLLNPDGYTRWMNPAEFLSGDLFGYDPGFWGTSESSENSGFVAGATLNPYKYFGASLAPDASLYEWLGTPGIIEGRGVFPSGSSCARDYELHFPTVGSKIVFIFNYAVLANWTEPDVHPVVDPLTAFPPAANALYPLHVFASSESQVFYTPDESGGRLSFEIEVFDWDTILNGGSVPEEVSKFMIWSDEPLVPGGSAEIMSTEVEWNSGFTASTSVASIEILGAVPEGEGITNVWIATESAGGPGYNQGFGAEVPGDPISTYVQVPVDVKNCPKAFTDYFDTDRMGKDSQMDDVLIYGEEFVYGNDLGVWIEQVEASGSPGSAGHTIVATDVQFINENTISADFDISDAPIGDYQPGCINGCGIITTPADHAEENKEFRVQVVPPPPWEISLSTGRNTASPAAIEVLLVGWGHMEDADLYRIYAKCYDVNGSVINDMVVGESSGNSFEIDLDTLPVTDAGIVEIWLTAIKHVNTVPYESYPSRSTFMYFNGFETDLGEWDVRAEENPYLRFTRSSMDSAYAGSWGLRAYGMVPYYPDLWIVFATPPISDVEGSKTVHFEFLHRHRGIYQSNGYQVGWCSELPEDGQTEVVDYVPITAVAYGQPYNDQNCTALQTEFNVEMSQDDNFQTDYIIYEGWYLSGFDLSDVLTEEGSEYIVVGFAGNYYDTFDLHLDEVALLVY